MGKKLVDTLFGWWYRMHSFRAEISQSWLTLGQGTYVNSYLSRWLGPSWWRTD